MRWDTIVLDATDTAKTVKELLGLTTKYQHIVKIVLYPEGGNNSGATGPARVGGSDVARSATPANTRGVPLVPGIIDTSTFSSVGGGVYHFDRIYVVGESGDVIQVGYLMN